MTATTPTFDTKDRQRVYEYVAEHEPVDVAELAEAEVVAVTPGRTRQLVAVLKRDGYVEERMGQLRTALGTDDETAYTAEEVEFAVRPARQADLSGLVGVIRQITGEGTYVVGESVGREFDAIADYVDALVHGGSGDGPMFFVAVLDGEVIGWVDLQEPGGEKLRGTAELTMGLLDEYRGQGIGGRLLEHAHDWANRDGYRKVFSSLPGTNQDAIEFLEENGWTVEATRPDHYLIDDDPVDEVLMAYTT